MEKRCYPVLLLGVSVAVTLQTLTLSSLVRSQYPLPVLYSGRLVARTPAFQVGEAGSKPVRSTSLFGV